MSTGSTTAHAALVKIFVTQMPPRDLFAVAIPFCYLLGCVSHSIEPSWSCRTKICIGGLLTLYIFLDTWPPRALFVPGMPIRSVSKDIYTPVGLSIL